jgi:hypothetical protein
MFTSAELMIQATDCYTMDAESALRRHEWRS